MAKFQISIKKLFNLTFNLRKSVHFVWESSPKLVFANVSLLFIQGVLPVFLLYTMKLLVDAITTAVAANPDESSFQPVLQVLILAASLALVNAVINRIGEFVTRVQGWSVVDHMNDVLQAKGIKADLEYYENPQYQDTLHRAQREATYRPIMILNSLAQIIQSSISLIGIGWLLFSYNWVVAPVLIIAVVPGIIARMFYSNRQYWLERKVTPQERESWYYHWIIISTDFAKEVRIFGLGATVRQRYQRLRSDIRRARTKLEFQNTFFAVFAQIISTSVVYALYGLIAYQTLKGQSTLGDFVMYFQAFQRGQNYLQNIFGSLARLYENNLFLSNLYEFLDLKQKVSEPLTPVSIPDPIQTGIVFDKVTFNYPNNSKTILKDINLCIRPGEVIALVGENGSGKTTLVKLLCRLYDPTHGSIRIDGTDLKDFASKDLHEMIGVIFQDYAHYNLTVSDNIWFGDVNRSKELGSIKAAAHLAEADQMISRLKDGYDTLLGTMFANGQELSIGQWQKIALSRAFFRKSQMIILDEPTSALDPKAEFELFSKFRELLEGRSAILISHRLSTVRMADRIFVISDGEIIESGNHDELMQMNSIYAKFFQQQAQNYR